MRFRLFGVNVEISVPFAVILAFLLLMDKTGLMSASLFAVFFHESGHIIAMKVLRCAPKDVKCCSAGILINGVSYCTIGENAIIAFSGPLANILFTIVFYILGTIFDSVILFAFAAVQLIVGVINLLPIKGLDGGSLLYYLLLNFSKVNAAFVCSFVSIFTAVAVSVAGAAVAVQNTGNPSLLLLGIYLLVINLMKR